MEKALVLYSGGLDSRLVVKILKEQGLEIEALYFNFPFGCGCCNLSCNFNFTQKELTKLTIIDCTKGILLKEYLEVLRNPRHGRGTAYNPCTDCKIFMFKKAKEYADKKKIKLIASGEVLGQRPMSQTKIRQVLIDKRIGFEVLRPLSAKLLCETSYERKGFVDREKFYSISGRSRKKQMELAKKFKIKYPNSAGGCLLCEKKFEKRFKELLKKDLINEKNLPLVSIGRHFIIDGKWFVVARNQEECVILENFKNCLKSKKASPSVYSESDNEKTKLELQEAFSTGSDYKKRASFDKYKL